MIESIGRRDFLARLHTRSRLMADLLHSHTVHVLAHTRYYKQVEDPHGKHREANQQRTADTEADGRRRDL